MMMCKVYTRSTVIPLSFARAAASVALHIFFALLVECCKLYDGERTVHALYSERAVADAFCGSVMRIT